MKNKAKTPQKPRFSRKMMGFDGGGLVQTSSTLRCTSKTTCGKNHGSFCFVLAGILTCRGSVGTVRSATRDGIANALRERQARSFVLRNGRTSCPLRKALIMPFRGEMSKRISRAFAVTERKENHTLREKGVRNYRRGLFLCVRFELLYNEEDVEP